MRILIATEKPFTADAVNRIEEKIEQAGHDFVLLEKYSDSGQLFDAVKEADALIVRSDRVDEQLFEHAPNLKIVVRAGAGYDNIDLDAATKHGVVAMNTPGQNANGVAELVFAMMLMSYRHFMKGSSGHELRGKRIGVHAYGNVASNVARIAKGFDMEVFAYDAYCAPEKMKHDDVIMVDSREDLYRYCDIVSIHVPLTEETRRSVDFDLMNLMPHDPLLINTARKEVMNEDDLLRLMTIRQDFCYMTDVMPGLHEILNSKFGDRYFSTPKKMGAQTAEANLKAGVAAADQIIEFFRTGDDHFRVN